MAPFPHNPEGKQEESRTQIVFPLRRSEPIPLPVEACCDRLKSCGSLRSNSDDNLSILIRVREGKALKAICFSAHGNPPSALVLGTMSRNIAAKMGQGRTRIEIAIRLKRSAQVMHHPGTKACVSSAGVRTGSTD